MKLKHEEEIESTLGFSLVHTGPEKMVSPVPVKFPFHDFCKKLENNRRTGSKLAGLQVQNHPKMIAERFHIIFWLFD